MTYRIQRDNRAAANAGRLTVGKLCGDGLRVVALYALLGAVAAREAWGLWARRRHPLRRLERETKAFARAAEREGRHWA